MNKCSQLEYLEEAVQLKKLHPDLEIKILACGNEIEGEYDWTAHKITSVAIDYWYVTDDEIMTDAGFIEDHLENYLQLQKEEIDEIWSKDIERVIAIRTGAA